MLPAKETSLLSGSKDWPRPPGRDRSRKPILRKLQWHPKLAVVPVKHLRINHTLTTGPACQAVLISSRSLNLCSAYRQDYSARSRRARTLDHLTHGLSYVGYAIRDGTTLLQHQECDRCEASSSA